ncbi:MAG: hypothetical protein ACXWMO_12700, partial [Syntrophales bacterium]
SKSPMLAFVQSVIVNNRALECLKISRYYTNDGDLSKLRFTKTQYRWGVFRTPKTYDLKIR